MLTNHIRQARTEQGLSQQKLAELAGISISYVKLLEDGESTPTITIARAVALALGVSVDDLWPTSQLQQAGNE